MKRSTAFLVNEGSKIDHSRPLTEEERTKWSKVLMVFPLLLATIVLVGHDEEKEEEPAHRPRMGR